MRVKMPSLRKPVYGLAAVMLAAAATLPNLFASPVSAAMLQNRSITLSSAVASATNVTYDIKFTPSATAIQGIVVDFCSNSPIIGEDCTAPTDMNIGTPTATISGTGLTDANWTESAASNTTLEYKGTSQETPGGEVTISLTGVENPSEVGSFYARIVTYASSAAVDTYSATNPGTTVDEGGVALSTTEAVSVSGTVQETLTFCVTATDITAPQNDCDDAVDDPVLELGEGDPKVLTTSPSTGNLYSKISTNAANGASIRMKTSNNCGGLKREGATGCDIAAVGTAPSALSGAQFGMRVSIAGDGLTAEAPYNHASDYGMDDQSAENVTTTYGDVVAKSTGVLDAVSVTYTFAAQAANTTPAGVYRADLTLIAVGTY